jgi:competence protein ComEC
VVDPLLVLALAALAGAFLVLAPGPALLGIGLVALALLVARRVSLRLVAVALVFVGVSALRARAALEAAAATHEVAVLGLTPPPRCEAEGVVVGSPVVLRGVRPEPGRDHGRVDVELVAGRCGTLAFQAPLGVRLYGAPESLVRGDRVSVVADLAATHLFRNEGLPDPRLALARTGIVASGGVVTLEVREAGSGLGAWIDRARAHVRARIDATYHAEAAPLARALVLGEVDLAEDDAQAFRRSGLSHLLAVSGTHLVVAILGLVAALRAVLRRIEPLARGADVGRYAALAGVPLAWLYADFAGASGSALRAAGMLTAGLLATGLGRRSNGTRALALSLLGPALLQPLAGTEPSFQLSAAATAGLLFLQAPIARVLVRGPRAVQKPMELVATTLAATLACAPVLALMSPELSALGVLANVVAAPLGEVAALPLCLLHAVLAPLPHVERGAALAGSGALLAVRAVARLAGGEGLGLPIPAPTAWQLAALAAGLAFVGAQTNWRRRALALGGAFALLVALEVVARHEGAPVGQLRVTALDVGQGDALLVDLPDGRLLAVDGGGMVGSPVDLGARVLLPVLRARRRERIDVLVLSHPHPDHYGGLPTVAKALPVGELWDSGQGEAEGAGPGYDALLAALRGAGAPVRRPSALCGAPRHFGAAVVTLLAPCPDATAGRGANDNSLVLRITHGDRAVLLVGDAEAEEEHDLLKSGQPLRADLLKVGHHGSRTSTTPAFLEAVGPGAAFVSSGVRNRFGHPHPNTLATLASHGVPTWRTDQHGAVVWETDGRAVAVREAAPW